MSATLESVTKRKRPELTAEEKLAEELVRRAKEQGLSLTGPDGLLKQLTKTVLETALSQEMTEHLGHEKRAPAVNETGNVRNGTRSKTVLTEASGQVGIEVPRDRDGTFEPQRHPRAGPGDLLEEGRELLMAVLGIAGAGHLAGRGLQRGEQRGGAVPDVVVAAPFPDPGPQRQHRRLTFQRLRLRFLV